MAKLKILICDCCGKKEVWSKENEQSYNSNYGSVDNLKTFKHTRKITAKEKKTNWYQKRCAGVAEIWTENKDICWECEDKIMIIASKAFDKIKKNSEINT